MALRKFIFVLPLSFLVLTFSCKNDKILKQNPTGNAGEILVVMNDSIKSSLAGLFIKDIVQQPMLGLPQEEPLFKMFTAPHREFDGNLMTFRNIITIDIDNKSQDDSLEFYKNVWAKDQVVAKITAKSKESLLDLLRYNEIKLVGFFLRAERNRNIDYFKAYPNAELIDLLKKQWGIYMTIPNTFKKNKGGENFTWLSEEGPVLSLGLIIYSFDYVGEGTFSKEYLLNKRDSVLQKNLPGPSQGSYMTTEHQYPVIYKKFTLDNNDVVELRGLWKVQNDVMGGPFISHVHYNKEKNKVIVTEGYVYSPEKPNKRNLMWKQEAILYTYKTLEKN